MVDFAGRHWVVLLAALLVPVVAAVGMPATDGHPPADEILNDTRDRYANAETVVGTAVVTVRNGTAETTATVDFVVADNRSRFTVHDEGRTYRVGTDGSVAWYAGPNRTAVRTVGTLRRPAGNTSSGGVDGRVATVLNRTDNRSDNVSVEYLREGSDDGTPAHVLRVRPTDGNGDRRATLWIATDDSRLLRAKITDGTNTTVVDFRATQFNVSVHGSTFAPPGDRIGAASIATYDAFPAAQANTSLDLPRLDAAFGEARVVQRSDGTAVIQRYRADEVAVTVVSTTLDRDLDRLAANATAVTVNGHAANVTTVDGTAVVYWRSEGVTTLVAVDASERRAVELARRLEE